VAASLAPDLDSRVSNVGRLLPFLSQPIEYHFGHRTITHSLVAQFVLCSLAYALLPEQYVLAITVGLVSHSVCDMMTARGVCWFWPSLVRCVIPGSPKYRFEIGGWGELAFAIVMALCGFLAVSVHQQTAGATGVLRAALGDITAARRDYDELKGSKAFTLRVRGRDNATFAQIDGEYLVRAGWGSNGFLIDTDAGVRTVCTAETCSWYSEHAVLVAGMPEVTTVRQVEVAATSAQSLRNALAPLQAAGDVFLSGSLQGQLQADGVTVQSKGERMILYQALPGVLAGTVPLRDVSLTVQVRHEGGVVVPEVTVTAVQNDSTIPETLLKWLE
jgi:inner membrane protein